MEGTGNTLIHRSMEACVFSLFLYEIHGLSKTPIHENLAIFIIKINIFVGYGSYEN
jgi:hypothetical protein